MQGNPLCQTCGTVGVPGSLVCPRCGRPYYPGQPQQQSEPPSQKAPVQNPYQQTPPGHWQQPPAQVPYPRQYSAGQGNVWVPAGTHSMLVALLLNLCCITGLGQIYNRQTLKGFVLMGSIIFIGFIFGFLTIPLWVIAVVDSSLIANRLNRGETISEWQWF